MKPALSGVYFKSSVTITTITGMSRCPSLFITSLTDGSSFLGIPFKRLFLARIWTLVNIAS